MFYEPSVRFRVNEWRFSFLLSAASNTARVQTSGCSDDVATNRKLTFTGKSIDVRAKADTLLSRDALEKAAAIDFGDHGCQIRRRSSLDDFKAVPSVPLSS